MWKGSCPAAHKFRAQNRRKGLMLLHTISSTKWVNCRALGRLLGRVKNGRGWRKSRFLVGRSTQLNCLLVAGCFCPQSPHHPKAGCADFFLLIVISIL